MMGTVCVSVVRHTLKFSIYNNRSNLKSKSVIVFRLFVAEFDPFLYAFFLIAINSTLHVDVEHCHLFTMEVEKNDT